jgi:hypothetical protein
MFRAMARPMDNGLHRGFAGCRDASEIQVGFGILIEILAGSGILLHPGKWD